MSNPSQPLPAAGAVREAIDLRRFPWIRPLVNAYANAFDSVAPLFAGNPADPAAWRDTIERVRQATRHMPALRVALEAQLTRRSAPEAARRNAARLGTAGTVAVVTGQQAGVFGGPLYTLLKAITAIQLARKVEAEHGVAAVPVFWVDEEDHDWDEARSTRILDAELTVREVALDELPGAGHQPVAALTLDAGIERTLAALQEQLAPTEFTGELMASLRSRYQPGRRVSEAFAGWIEDLLGRHGLIVFEAGDKAVKPLVGDLFRRELETPCRTARLAREAGEQMSRLGHAPQVEPAEDSVALFYLDGAGRRAIRRHGEDFIIGDVIRPADELRREADTHPERFSPNVVLRPVVQDRLFPTVCYVAGPSELAYQAQLRGIYAAFGVEVPLLFSRASATLLDSGAVRFLDRFRLPLEDLHAQDESALNRLLDSQLPPTVDQAIEETEALVQARARLLKDVVVGLDPTLAGAVDTTADRMRDTLKTLHNKIIHAAKRKDDTLRRQFNRTRALAFPDGDPQERVLSVAFFVNRYGPSVGDRLLEVLPLSTDRHYVLTL